ncbi:MAG TPA: flagellar assembly peptidoglycan hydrolase FlgJ, partial [Oxalicibacterium sp.]|nr:flagellar assembly peptidoglycan hydrolase FlgJ [Oxalicibacterium sp.]
TPADNTSNDLAIDSKNLESLKTAARQNSPEAVKAAAKQFEALFLNMMMKSMRDAAPQDGMFDNSQTRLYTSMLDQQMSQNLASRGVGLADMLVRQLSPKTANAADIANDGKQAEGAALDASSLPARVANPFADRFGALRSLPSEGNKPLKGVGKSASNQPAHVQAFQEKLAAHAEEASRTTGIPAKFMLGQAALESGWGKHVIKRADGSSSHNLFGIKAGASWKGKTVTAVTTEYVNGVPHKRMEKFRAYDSYADSFRDYAKMLRSNPRYEKVLANASDLKGFAQGLQRAGYATDPHYAAKLQHIINRNLSV